MPQILIGGDAKQPASGLEANRELKVGEIGAAVAAAQPVLLLGEIVVANASAVQFAQRHLGRMEVGDIAERLCEMQRHPVDEAAYQRLLSGPQQFRTDAEVARQCQRAAFAAKQMPRRNIGPPRHLIEPAQHRIDFAGLPAVAAALDGGEHVALQQHAFGPFCGQRCGVLSRQRHEVVLKNDRARRYQLTRRPECADNR